jgi:hypothetical protein
MFSAARDFISQQRMNSALFPIVMEAHLCSESLHLLRNASSAAWSA